MAISRGEWLLGAKKSVKGLRGVALSDEFRQDGERFIHVKLEDDWEGNIPVSWVMVIRER